MAPNTNPQVWESLPNPTALGAGTPRVGVFEASFYCKLISLKCAIPKMNPECPWPAPSVIFNSQYRRELLPWAL